MPQVDVLLSGGTVVFPGSGTKNANIGISGESITGIYDPNVTVHAKTIIDASGLHILPGAIDAHEHLGIYNDVAEDFRDTIQHAVGGVTTVVNYDRAPVGYHDFFPKLKQAGEENSYIDFAYSLGILTEQHIDEIESYVQEFGMTSFKFFRNYERQLNDKFKVSNGIDLSSDDLVRILRKFKEISPRMLLGVHCENMDINRACTARLKNSGEDKGMLTWSKTSPGFAEAESLLSTLYLNSVVGGNVYLVHMSSAASMAVLKQSPWLMEGGVRIETCPHYLTLTENEPVLDGKVGPPIHSQEDQESLWRAIEAGIIQGIGTDHVPNSRAVKYAAGEGVWGAKYGFAGAGAMLPLMISEGHLKRGIPLETISDITSRKVAEAFNLPSKGRIEPGCDADFAIVDLSKWKEITPKLMHAASDYSVYQGKQAAGWPVYTISRGEVVVDHGEPTAASGRGRYIFREA